MYNNFILNLCIVYELNNWPRNRTNNFPLKKCSFGAVKLVRNTFKKKFSYNGPRKAFDGEGSWSFGNGFARNVVIFDFDKFSSYHIDKLKNNFLVLGEGPTGAAEKYLVLTLVKQIQNFA